MSLIETDTRSLQERKEEITERAANKILDSISQSQMTQKEYQECITYLCEHCCNKSQSSQPLSSSPSPFSYSFFPPDRINAQRIGTISFDIKALDEITRMPIAHTKIQLENANIAYRILFIH